MNSRCRFIGIILAMAMLLGMVPMAVLAAGTTPAECPPPPPPQMSVSGLASDDTYLYVIAHGKIMQYQIAGMLLVQSTALPELTPPPGAPAPSDTASGTMPPPPHFMALPARGVRQQRVPVRAGGTRGVPVQHGGPVAQVDDRASSSGFNFERLKGEAIERPAASRTDGAGRHRGNRGEFRLKRRRSDDRFVLFAPWVILWTHEDTLLRVGPSGPSPGDRSRPAAMRENLNGARLHAAGPSSRGRWSSARVSFPASIFPGLKAAQSRERPCPTEGNDFAGAAGWFPRLQQCWSEERKPWECTASLSRCYSATGGNTSAS